MQKALLVKEIGKPLSLGTRPIPKPKARKVVVKVTAAQVLPHDTASRDKGLFISNHLPSVPAHNIAGIVQELGPDVTEYSIGQHIYGQGDPLAVTPDQCGLQEFAILPTNMSAPVPDNFSDDQMVTLPINATTIFCALFHQNWLGFPAPFSPESKTFDYGKQKLVIIGGNSNCGRFAIQFAKMVGIGTIIAIASLSGEQELKTMGASHVIDRYSQTIVKEVQEICGGEEEVTHVVDTVTYDFDLAMEMVATHCPSSIAVLHVADVTAQLEKRGKKWGRGSGVSGWKNNFDEETGKLYWESLGKWVQEGKILIPKFRVIEGLDEVLVNEALDSYIGHKPVVQAVIHPR
ncbi:related to alcohol dehydrogenase, zinc-containing [Phialocephala subalpina]|uniref:Related to alcohol dehydrogenase, zinc-containing n=1 Tax=Phialocephala subalpina TaxID=576137 RepID=A0A1L7WZM6_9HELO|nr:related to alcohol dehydrogenase, zinc-containing [Phialocephala subalpina]